MKKINFGAIVKRGLGGAAGGAAVVGINKVSPFYPMITNAGAALIGSAIPEFAPKNELVASAGAGMIGASVANVLTRLFPGLARMSGADDVVGDVGDALDVTETFDNVSGTDDDEVSGNSVVGTI